MIPKLRLIVVFVILIPTFSGHSGGTGQTKARGDMIEDVDRVINTAEDLLAWAHGKDWYISQAVYTLVGICRKSAVDNKARFGVVRIDKVIIFVKAADISGGQLYSISKSILGECDNSIAYSWAILVDLVILTMVWVGSKTLCEGIARVPI